MCFGVPAGACRPYHTVPSTLGRPASFIVGTSGYADTRAGLVTASARTRPDLRKAWWPATASKNTGTSPAASAGAPVPLPLYGMCWIGRAVTILNNSPTMCGALPVPGEPKLMLAGLDLASAITSATVFTGACAWDSMNTGMVAARMIGVKSLTGSYGRLV